MFLVVDHEFGRLIRLTTVAFTLGVIFLLWQPGEGSIYQLFAITTAS